MYGCGQVGVSGGTYSSSGARSWLARCPVDSEAAQKLRSALIKTVGIIEISLPQGSFKVDTLADSLRGGVRPSYPSIANEEVNLKGLPQGASLLLKGALPIHFWDIVSLAEQLYGQVDNALADEEARFEEVLNRLEKANARVVRAMLEEAYRKRQTTPPLRGLVDQLLMDRRAEEAYATGHSLALRMAREAEGNCEKLKKAYAIEAVACHFLTRLFSVGRLRIDERRLKAFSDTFEFPQPVQQLLRLLMAAQYEKDGYEGLNVESEEGGRWRAYGDGCCRTEQNSKNHQQMILAVQQSVDELHQAVQSPARDVPQEVLSRRVPKATQWNSPPLYDLNEENTRLFLRRDGQVVELTNAEDLGGLLSQLAHQVFRYLPRNSVLDFIGPVAPIPGFNLPEWDPMMPQVGRLTRDVWEVFGRATDGSNDELQEKVNQAIGWLGSYSAETLDRLLATNEGSLGLEEMNRLRVAWQGILDNLSKAGDYLMLTDSAGAALEEGYTEIERALDGETTQALLCAYAEAQAQNAGFGEENDFDPEHARYHATLFFNRVLMHQVQVFQLCQIRKIFQKDRGGLLSEVLALEEWLVRQIDANKEMIHPHLVCEESHYIDMKLRNHTVNRHAVDHLLQRAARFTETPSYCSQTQRDRASPRLQQNAITEVFLEILKKPLLCWHDVNDLNQIYHALDRKARAEVASLAQIPLVLEQLNERVVQIGKAKSENPDGFISIYHLRNFVEGHGIEAAFQKLKDNFEKLDQKQKTRFDRKVALKMPFCVSAEQFEKDRRALISNNYTEESEVGQVIAHKSSQIAGAERQRRRIEGESRPPLPSHFGEVLERGHLSLYDHLREMQGLEDREARLNACNRISFSDLSRIVLEVMDAIVATVEEAIPKERRGTAIFFLLGNTGGENRQP